jgi:hypothetical protein
MRSKRTLQNSGSDDIDWHCSEEWLGLTGKTAVTSAAPAQRCPREDKLASAVLIRMVYRPGINVRDQGYFAANGTTVILRHNLASACVLRCAILRARKRPRHITS